jgi:hypothetical protein
LRPYWLGRGVVGVWSSQAAVMIHRSEGSSLTASSVARLAPACDSRRPCLGATNRSRRPADWRSPMRPEGSCIDRPNTAPLLRFFPLQRSLAVLRYPGQPATGRSRCGVGPSVG